MRQELESSEPRAIFRSVSGEWLSYDQVSQPLAETQSTYLAESELEVEGANKSRPSRCPHMLMLQAKLSKR